MRSGSVVDFLCSGLLWKDAWVVRRDGKVFLRLRCKDHGTQETVYCASADFFDKVPSHMRRLSWRSPSRRFSLTPSSRVRRLPLVRLSAHPVAAPKSSDIEDLREKMNYSQKSKNTPVMMELGMSSVWASCLVLANQQLCPLQTYTKDKRF